MSERLATPATPFKRQAKARAAMTADQQLSLYDGRRFLGTITERGDKSCIAKDASGRKLGKFSSAQKASSAISEADNAQSRSDADG